MSRAKHVAFILLLCVPMPPATGCGKSQPHGTYEGKSMKYWIRALDDNDEATRYDAVTAMETFGPAARAAVPRLAVLVRDPRPELRD